MKRLLLFFFSLCLALEGQSQETQSSDSTSWEFSAEGNFYFFTDDFIFLPVFKADKNKLHLEGRYNYEDMNTVSGWFGINLTGGKKATFTLTPMVGAVAGNTNGVATGFEFTLEINRFELYSESEYLFDFSTSDNNFGYTWTDFSYSFNDNFWIGISAQRTRLYQTALELQRGLLVGFGKKDWEVTGYLYNIGFDTAFGLLTVSKSF